MFAPIRKKFEKITTPNDVYSVLRICAFLSKISLIFPFKLKNRTLELQPKFAIFNFILQITLNIIMIAGFLCAFLKTEFENNPYLILGFIRTLLFNLFTFFATIIMNQKSKKIIKIFDMINKIESEVKLQSKRLRRMFFALICECCFLMATWSLFAANSLASENFHTSKRIFFTFVGVFGVKLIPELFFVHFLDLIYLVGCFIDEIHDKMKLLSYHSESFSIVPAINST